MNRYFFALDLTPQNKEDIAYWRKETLSELAFKPVDKGNFHITLAFLGHLTDEQFTLLSSKTSRDFIDIDSQSIYSLTFDTLGLFKKPKVLFIANSAIPLWLSLLANNVSLAAINLGLFQEQRPYHPHITLLRKATFIPKLIPSLHLTINIKSFSLYQSTSHPSGVEYKSIKRWFLE